MDFFSLGIIIMGIVGIALTIFGRIKEIPSVACGGELMSIMTISCMLGWLIAYVN